MLRLITRLTLVLSLITISLITQACGNVSFQRAAEISKDITGGGLDVERKVTEVWNRPNHGGLTLEQKDRLADILLSIGRGSKAAADTFESLYNEFGPDTTKVPILRLNQLAQLLNQNITAPFLSLLVEVGKLNAENSALISVTIAALRTFVLRLSNVFGSGVAREIRNKIEKVENDNLSQPAINILRNGMESA